MRKLLVVATSTIACYSPDDPAVGETTGSSDATVTTTVEPTDTEATATEPTATDPSATDPTDTDPTDTDPTDPTDTDPTDTDPTDTDPTTTDATTEADSSSSGPPAPVCGDGMAEGEEPCDDGDDIDTNECTNACTLPVCGDSIVSDFEVCDDGNLDEDDFCSNVCTSTLRRNLLLCGSSTRDVATFIPDGALLQVVSSCIPDGDTQAMLITRDGTVDAATLQPYVAAGGILLTEVFISDDVYNAVFGTAVTEVGFSGSCSDLAPTVQQFSGADPFWADNVFQAITLEESGCGNNVIAYPGLIALAGWAVDAVSIGYRDNGAGRVWVTEFDWSDPDAVVYDYTEQLMGYMIVHGG